MTNRSEKRYLLPILLVIVLAVQAVMMGYFGNKKAGYHMDEIYTYELANYEETFLARTENFMETWVDGMFYQESMTLDGVSDLDYSIPYQNQEKDVHPPLYYFIIHTASAFFPGTFSKWIGILPNIFFCLMTTVILFMVSKKIFANQGLALVVTAFWAWSVGSMSTAIFIRMYAMLTFICIALVCVHVMAMEDVKRERLRKRTVGLLFLLTLAGILTQYYYLIFCFFLCGIFFLYLCITRRWRILVQYTVIEGGALGAAVAIFPRMIYHIFGGYRGREAFENIAQEGGYLADLETMTTIISRQLCNGWLKEAVLLVAVVLIVYVLWVCLFPVSGEKRQGRHGVTVERGVPRKNRFQSHVSKTDIGMALLAMVSVGYVMLIGKVAPYKTDRYIFCVYPLLAMCLGYFGYRILCLLLGKPGISVVVLAGLAVGITVASYQMQNVSYLFPEAIQRQKDTSAYLEYPVVTLSLYGKSDNTADVFAVEFFSYPQIFRCNRGDFSGIKRAVETKDISDGFLLVLQDYGTTSDEEIRGMIEDIVALERFELISEAECHIYFCTLEEAAS